MSVTPERRNHRHRTPSPLTHHSPFERSVDSPHVLTPLKNFKRSSSHSFMPSSSAHAEGEDEIAAAIHAAEKSLKNTTPQHSPSPKLKPATTTSSPSRPVVTRLTLSDVQTEHYQWFGHGVAKQEEEGGNRSPMRQTRGDNLREATTPPKDQGKLFFLREEYGQEGASSKKKQKRSTSPREVSNVTAKRKQITPRRSPPTRQPLYPYSSPTPFAEVSATDQPLHGGPPLFTDAIPMTKPKGRSPLHTPRGTQNHPFVRGVLSNEAAIAHINLTAERTFFELNSLELECRMRLHALFHREQQRIQQSINAQLMLRGIYSGLFKPPPPTTPSSTSVPASSLAWSYDELSEREFNKYKEDLKYVLWNEYLLHHKMLMEAQQQQVEATQANDMLSIPTAGSGSKPGQKQTTATSNKTGRVYSRTAGKKGANTTVLHAADNVLAAMTMETMCDRLHDVHLKSILLDQIRHQCSNQDMYDAPIILSDEIARATELFYHIASHVERMDEKIVDLQKRANHARNVKQQEMEQAAMEREASGNPRCTATNCCTTYMDASTTPLKGESGSTTPRKGGNTTPRQRSTNLSASSSKKSPSAGIDYAKFLTSPTRSLGVASPYLWKIELYKRMKVDVQLMEGAGRMTLHLLSLLHQRGLLNRVRITLINREPVLYEFHKILFPALQHLLVPYSTGYKPMHHVMFLERHKTQKQYIENESHVRDFILQRVMLPDWLGSDDVSTSGFSGSDYRMFQNHLWEMESALDPRSILQSLYPEINFSFLAVPMVLYFNFYEPVRTSDETNLMEFLQRHDADNYIREALHFNNTTSNHSNSMHQQKHSSPASKIVSALTRASHTMMPGGGNPNTNVNIPLQVLGHDVSVLVSFPTGKTSPLVRRQLGGGMESSAMLDFGNGLPSASGSGPLAQQLQSTLHLQAQLPDFGLSRLTSRRDIESYSTGTWLLLSSDDGYVQVSRSSTLLGEYEWSKFPKVGRISNDLSVAIVESFMLSENEQLLTLPVRNCPPKPTLQQIAQMKLQQQQNLLAKGSSTSSPPRKLAISPQKLQGRKLKMSNNNNGAATLMKSSSLSPLLDDPETLLNPPDNMAKVLIRVAARGGSSFSPSRQRAAHNNSGEGEGEVEGSQQQQNHHSGTETFSYIASIKADPIHESVCVSTFPMPRNAHEAKLEPAANAGVAVCTALYSTPQEQEEKEKNMMNKERKTILGGEEGKKKDNHRDSSSLTDQSAITDGEDDDDDEEKEKEKSLEQDSEAAQTVWQRLLIMKDVIPLDFSTYRRLEEHMSMQASTATTTSRGKNNTKRGGGQGKTATTLTCGYCDRVFSPATVSIGFLQTSTNEHLVVKILREAFEQHLLKAHSENLAELTALREDDDILAASFLAIVLKNPSSE